MEGWIPGAIAGLVTGAIASLIAPWVHWAVEKRRSRQTHRRKLLKEWREMLAVEADSGKGIIKHPSYGSLQPHLTNKVLAEMEGDSLITVASSTVHRDPYISMLSQEVSRIEKEWGLV